MGHDLLVVTAVVSRCERLVCTLFVCTQISCGFYLVGGNLEWRPFSNTIECGANSWNILDTHGKMLFTISNKYMEIGEAEKSDLNLEIVVFVKAMNAYVWKTYLFLFNGCVGLLKGC